jgi:hypothetical protein
MLPQRTRTYVTPVYDSTRWDAIALRPDDIIVCTPPKSGTTWTQMICALLVHQSTELPQPLGELSRWVDRTNAPVEEVAAAYAAQPHRRILKTHTPLDGLPYRDDVSYVFCGRDPRDAFLSMLDHGANLSDAARARIMEEARRLGSPRDALPADVDELFRIWQTRPAHPWMEDGFPFGSFTYIASTFWDFRELPNLFFLHYADLMQDLDAEMRRLSGFLGIPVDAALWPLLVEAASFQSMKLRADETAPGASRSDWKDNSAFFRAARMGHWRQALSPGSQALYEELHARRLDPRLKAWIECGRHAAEPKPRLQ